MRRCVPGLSIRDYGFFDDLTRYSAPPPYNIPLERFPYQTNTQVAYPTIPELTANFDPYFRGYDNAFPDYYREIEWEREFDQFVKYWQPSEFGTRSIHARSYRQLQHLNRWCKYG